MSATQHAAGDVHIIFNEVNNNNNNNINNNNNHNHNHNPLPRKSMMTCTSTRQCHKPSVAAAATQDLEHAAWLAAQRKDVQEYHAARQQAFIRQHDADMVMSEHQRHVAIKMLIGEAAKYHTKRDMANLDVEVRKFRKQWWGSFKGQVDTFLQATAADPNAASSAVRAVENISSLGVWFVGDGISMPSRKYAMLAYSHDAQSEGSECQATMQPVYVPIVVVGMCQFSYSNYVHEARLHGQTAVLRALTK